MTSVRSILLLFVFSCAGCASSEGPGNASQGEGTGTGSASPTPSSSGSIGNSGGSQASGATSGGGSSGADMQPVAEGGSAADAGSNVYREGGSDATAGGCGTRRGMRGKTTRTLSVSGQNRTYLAYLPQSADPGKSLPFVYVFHGATQTGANLFDITQYSVLADSEGIAVVFPDGQGTSSATGVGALNPWSVSDGQSVCGLGTLVSNLNAVDLTFVDAIRADVEQDQCLDPKHTFATGFSMGGYFTHHIACDRPDFRAAAPHSGGTIADLGGCKTGHMPIVIFHGVADPLIADGCDDPGGSAQSGFPPSATLWAKKNGCGTTYKTLPETGSNGNNGQCIVYDGCPADGQVELCTFPNLAHAWAGADTCPGCIGSGAGYASATKLEWAFFKQYAW